MIWIDFDNAPHVPLLVPLVNELERRGEVVYCTARDFTQTIPLLKQSGISFHQIGKGFGSSKWTKVYSLGLRLMRLLFSVPKGTIKLAVNHGSRTQTACAWLLGIPSIVMIDYEHTESLIFRKFASFLLTPKIIPKDHLEKIGFKSISILQYDGLKEQIYLPDFSPDPHFRQHYNIPEEKILVTIRPPAVDSNYHDARSEKLLITLIDRLLKSSEYFFILLPKTDLEEKRYRKYFESLGLFRNYLIPEQPLHGLQLIWNSDVVVSGGGTMNREAALLGVPVFSIFTARKGAVDEYLQSTGKLKFLNSIEEIKHTLFLKRKIDFNYTMPSMHVRDEIIKTIMEKLKMNDQ